MKEINKLRIVMVICFTIILITVFITVAWINTPTEWTFNLVTDDNTRQSLEIMANITAHS